MSLLYHIFSLGNPNDPDPETRDDWEKRGMKKISGEPSSFLDSLLFCVRDKIAKIPRINGPSDTLDSLFGPMYGYAAEFSEEIPGFVAIYLGKLTTIREDYVGDRDRVLVLMAGDSRLEGLRESNQAKIPIWEDAGSYFAGRYFLGTLADNPENNVIGLLTLRWLANPRSRVGSPVSNLWGFADSTYTAFE